MLNGLSALFATYVIQVRVDTAPGEKGFCLTAPGLLGCSYYTSPALTARILASPEFDQLFGAAQAQRILELVLEAAAASPGPATP